MNNAAFPHLICSCDTLVFHGGMNLIYMYRVNVLALFCAHCAEGGWGFILTLQRLS